MDNFSIFYYVLNFQEGANFPTITHTNSAVERTEWGTTMRRRDMTVVVWHDSGGVARLRTAQGPYGAA